MNKNHKKTITVIIVLLAIVLGVIASIYIHSYLTHFSFFSRSNWMEILICLFLGILASYVAYLVMLFIIWMACRLIENETVTYVDNAFISERERGESTPVWISMPAGSISILTPLGGGPYWKLYVNVRGSILGMSVDEEGWRCFKKGDRVSVRLCIRSLTGTNIESIQKV